MLTMNEPSLTKAADPVSVGIGSTLNTSAGSVAFNGLEKRGAVVTCSPKYNSPPVESPTAAEELTVPPVASGEDPQIICSWCSFQVRAGRGSLVRVDRCHLCEMEGTND